MTNVTDTASLGGPARPSGRRGSRRLALIIVAILAVIAVVLTGGAFAYAKQFEGKALPGTTVLGQDVAGKTPEEIAALVTERAEGVTVTVTAGEETHEVPLADLGVSVDAEGTARAAVEHDESFTGVLASSWSGERAVAPLVTVDEAAVTAYATGLVPADETEPVDAQVVFDEETEEWSAVPGTDGRGIDPQPLLDAVNQQAASLESFSVEQPIEQIAPAITTEEAEGTLGEITALLEQPMSIQGPEGETHEISSERRSSWLSVAPDETGQALAVTVDEDAVREWVAERAEKDSVEVKDGIEQVDAEGTTVKVVAEKEDGLEVTNTEAVADEVIASLTGTTPLEAAFETQTVEAKVEKVDAPTEEETDTTDPANAPTGEKWIDVDLTAKTVTAYVGSTPVWGPRSMVDGKEGYETVTGSYEIYLRYDMQDMTNASRYPVGHEKYYYTEDVPWVQYFHNGYGFHGAPWRSSFGYSGSHGCINMPPHEAKWLYDWASIGTRVEVHY
ncbi:L,D-transpeptidase family protein [Brachybacterium sp. J144]|uniref:L,D-transpeptidase family protein n=1 Tax=Brachybacterium sp. J144 TaxID=3116487 RepID=UPI002E7862E5|nr:L,D-transpeptidase family protein [Brachybacterium sp. J144]MEE1649188.1 L,D-transpeptidase family protein [Brachybacterium sp. J144]